MIEELRLKIKYLGEEQNRLNQRIEAANKELLRLRNLAVDVASVNSTQDSDVLVKACLELTFH